MGIARAGHSGAGLGTVFGPPLAQSPTPGLLGGGARPLASLTGVFNLQPEATLGWRFVFGLALAPLALTFLTFALFARDSPQQPAPKPLRAYGAVLGMADTWWFCIFYSVTFGGFVGLAS